MQGVAFDTIVRLLDAGVGIVDCAHPYLVTTGEAQARTDPILELERRTETVALDLGVLECRDTCLLYTSPSPRD